MTHQTCWLGSTVNAVCNETKLTRRLCTCDAELETSRIATAISHAEATLLCQVCHLTHSLTHSLTDSLAHWIWINKSVISNRSTNEGSLVTVSSCYASFYASFRQTSHSLCSLNTTSLASKWLWQTQAQVASSTEGFLSSPALCPSGRQGYSAAGLCCIWSSRPKLIGHQLASTQPVMTLLAGMSVLQLVPVTYGWHDQNS